MGDVAIAVRASATGAISNGTGVSLASASTTAASDYLLAFATFDFAASTSTTNPGIGTTSGVTWALIGSTTPGASGLNTKAWLGTVTTAGQKTIGLTGGSGSWLVGHLHTLDPGGGLITVDGLTTLVTGNPKPAVHGAVSPAGTQDMLWAFTGIHHSAVAAMPTNPFTTPSGMTFGSFSGGGGSNRSLSAYQQLAASGSTGTRSVDWTATGTPSAGGVSGMMFALRSEAADPPAGQEPGRLLLAC
jgi:hypothetical protein